MKKEIFKLNPFVAYYILQQDSYERSEDKFSEENLEIAKSYKLIESKLIGSDEEDGGWDRTAIIQRKSDGKFFSINYQQWDFHWEKGDIKNWSPEFEEVFPKEKIIIIYE